MSTLHEAAAQGILLTSEDLKKYHKSTRKFDIDELDSKGRSALCYAAWKGHVGVVKFLISEGANVNKLSNGNRSALWYAASGFISQQNRLQIMKYLLGKGAAVDSQSEDGCTPLMRALIGDSDPEVISLLVNHGASTKVRKGVNGPTANDLAKATGKPKVIWALKHEPDCPLCRGSRFLDIMGAILLVIIATQRAASGNRLIDLIIGAILAIIAVEPSIPRDRLVAITVFVITITNSFVKGASGDSNSRAFDDVEEAELDTQDIDLDTKIINQDTECADPDIKETGSYTEGTDPIVGDLRVNIFRQPLSLVDLMEHMKNYLTETGLSQFFADKEDFIRYVVKKAMELKDDLSNPLRRDEDIRNQAILALYQPVVYCDDSSSMKRGTRANDQRELVRRITRITTALVPDGYGTSLQFINHVRDLDDSLSARQAHQIVENVQPRGNTRIGTGLRYKILNPLVYNQLQQPEDKLKRPILISSITDGSATGEPPEAFKTEILECVRFLREKGYRETAIQFQISQLGDDEGAEDFLRGLNTVELRPHLYCTTDRLDEKYRKFHENEEELERWLLCTLMAPLLNRPAL